MALSVCSVQKISFPIQVLQTLRTHKEIPILITRYLGGAVIKQFIAQYIFACGDINITHCYHRITNCTSMKEIKLDMEQNVHDQYSCL